MGKESTGYYLEGNLTVHYNKQEGGFVFSNISIFGKPNTTLNLTFRTSSISYHSLNSTIKLQNDY